MGLLDHEIEKGLSSERAREREGLRLIDPHQRGVDHEAAIHAKRQRELHRLDGVVAAIRVAGIVGLAHSGNQMFQPAPVGDRAGEGEKDEIAARHERGRQVVRGHLDRRLAGQRGVGDRAERVEPQEMILAEPHLPGGLQRPNPLAQARPDLKLDCMALAIIEPDRLHLRETFQRPGETDGRVLAAGKKNERLFSRKGHPQSQAGACATATTRPPGLERAAICFISASDRAKSKIDMFSFSRSTFEVRGITT
jgi:hypothetical protein